MVSPALLSSSTDEWATPQELFDKLNGAFHFTLDPCATPENAKCSKFYTREQDGLKQDWGGGRYMVQSAIRQNYWRLGSEMRRPSWSRCDVDSGKNRHKVVA